MRFAISPNDPRFAVLVVELDRDEVPMAQTWRDVAGAAERLGMKRPSYQHVRRLVRIERRRRQLEAAGRAVLGRAATTLAAGRVPSAVLVLERLKGVEARGGACVTGTQGLPAALGAGGRVVDEPRLAGS